MRQAAASQQAGTPQSEADARRAAEQLKEAEQALSSLRNQQSGSKVDDLARQADDLAQRQQNFEGQLRRAVTGQSGQQGQQEQPGPFGRQLSGGGRMSQQQAQQLSDDRSKETDDLKRLEQQMQNAVRELAGTQPKASGKLREALGQMQQQELPRDMQRNGEYIRRGLGEYAVLSESMITQGMNNLRDQLHGVQQAMEQDKEGKGAGDDKENKAVEQALNQVERLRQQIEALQQQQRRQNGQNGQPGQQQGQGQNGQQQGQQNGQGGGNQAGGNQQGSLSRNGQQNGPNGAAFGPNNATNYGLGGGLWYGNPNGGVRADVERDYRDTLEQLGRLQGQLQNDPNTLRDLQSLVREMQRLNPFTYSNDGELSGRIQAAMVADIERVELELRRKVDEATSGGSTRSAGNQPIPQGYADAVAEYFRKLSSSK
jgi:hypothetical protein